MGPSQIEAGAFEALPSPTGVVDSDGCLAVVNDEWRSARDCLDVFDLNAGDDLFGASVSVAADDADFGSCVRDVLNEDERDDPRVFSLAGDAEWVVEIAGFDCRGKRYALAVFVDTAVVNADALTPRERLQNLEGAVHVLSHDLRNSLNVIDGYADLLDAADSDEEQAIERIQAASARASSVVDDALALARGPDISPDDRVDLRALAEDAWAGVDADDGDASLRVEDTAVFAADRDLLHRAFENLFVNALQHGGTGVTVRVGVLPEPESATVGVYVEDDGPGFDAAELGTVFEPGYTSDPANGHGLGLSIVSTIVDAHGWAITAANADTGGARFEISGVYVV